MATMKLNNSQETYGGLTCRVIDALPQGQQPDAVMVLCHGFGAPGDDLAAFGPHLLSSSEDIAERYRFVFPEAPIDLTPMGMPGGRAWWPINMAQLAEINQTEDYSKLTTVEPPGMSAASDQLAATVKEIQAANGIDDSATVLGGFSQGAMVTSNIVLRDGFVPKLMVLFSGTLLNSEVWKKQAANHAGCPVLQSHGRQDMVLPFAPATLLRDMLTENGFDVDFHAFIGPHTIPMEVLTELMRQL
ncbi:alpha/beta hydrolase [Fuerstiella marisgermanici]|nr:dienelactone hydrolase family protein [Fuerstiella marisgermanici]